MNIYREQEFVERCVCEDAAVGACACCGRARCAFHLERGLCIRCTQAIGRELDARANHRWAVAGVTGTTITLAALVMNLTIGIAIGLPLAIALLPGLKRRQRRRLIAQMGPTMSALQGELPSPVRTIDTTSDISVGRDIPGPY